MKDLRIAFTGTHSTGKTTLCDHLSETLGIAKIVDITRDTPKELRGTKMGQDLVLTNYLYKVSRLSGSYVIDRTILDIIAYSLTYKIGWDSVLINGLIKFYKDSNFFPTHLFYLPIEFELVQDGQRPDVQSRINVDSYIQELFSCDIGLHVHTITGSVEERLHKIHKILKE